MAKGKIAYIAGKVRGLPTEQVAQKFKEKQSALELKGYRVVNPVEQVSIENFYRKMDELVLPLLDDVETRHDTMRFCLSWLLKCDELHLLSDWDVSEGANAEVVVAKMVGIKIVYPLQRSEP
jgi:hypothetical protein